MSEKKPDVHRFDPRLAAAYSRTENKEQQYDEWAATYDSDLVGDMGYVAHIDAGNVFNTNCRANQVNCFGLELGELRYSYGLGITWLSGFGPLTFSLAKPLNASLTDRREVFQFTLGRGF